MPKNSSINRERKKLDQVTNDDFEIFRLAATNANYFFDHYTRTPTSGTYWRQLDPGNPTTFDADRQRAWEIMRQAWIKEGRPDKVFVFKTAVGEKVYQVQWDGDEPVFFQPHGWLAVPYQLQIIHAAQSDITVIGGVGSGKTVTVAMWHAFLAAVTPYYRGFAVAPQMMQAKEAYNYITTNLAETPYWDRWILKATERPTPQIVLGNSYVGRSSIEFYSAEDDPRKILTLEGDTASLDQAEKFDNLDEIQRVLGSRLRGTVRGRPRLNKLLWIANSADNPELWYRFDQGEFQPQFYLSLNPRSQDNPYLSKHDIEVLKRRIAKDASPEDIEVWMEGKRPMGSGEHFTRKQVEAATNHDLNRILDECANAEPGSPKQKDGYVYRQTHQLGVFHFEFPPETKIRRDYIVISDPGSANPPDRNSAAIMVFDVTEFPQKKMRMVAFNWVRGDGSYWPWVMAYKDYVERYKAFGRNAFDSTGVQKGFDELVFADLGLAAEGMNMAVSGKMLSLNALKFFLAKGLIEWPYIAHLSNQLTNYKLPDNKLRQDLVMTLAMAAAWARRLYWVELDDHNAEPQVREREVIDRYDRPIPDRYSGRLE